MKQDAIFDIVTSEIKIKDEKDYRCAPSKEYNDGSCISLNMLIEMVNAYNKMNTENKIKTSSTMETLNPKKYKKYLIKQFNIKLKNICDNQRCWLKQDFVDIMKNKNIIELRKYTFRPEGPQGKFTWLNTFNINEVMAQYEDKYKNFKFLGAVPIDFDDWSEYGIKNLDIDELIEKGKYKFGIIYNLDKRGESGSHWVAGYYDLQNGNVYFFDSYGEKPNMRIRKMMRRFTKYIKEILNKKPHSDYNKYRHQYKNSECGVYSINFILRLLKGESFEKITQNKTFDDEINKCRKVYFT